MGAEARLRAFLGNVLSGTWIAVASLAVAVAADVLADIAPRPAVLLVFVAPIGSVVGAIVCRNRAWARGILAGLVSTAICLYAGLVTLLLFFGAFTGH